MMNEVPDDLVLLMFTVDFNSLVLALTCHRFYSLFLRFSLDYRDKQICTGTVKLTKEIEFVLSEVLFKSTPLGSNALVFFGVKQCIGGYYNYFNPIPQSSHHSLQNNPKHYAHIFFEKNPSSYEWLIISAGCPIQLLFRVSIIDTERKIWTFTNNDLTDQKLLLSVQSVQNKHTSNQQKWVLQNVDNYKQWIESLDQQNRFVCLGHKNSKNCFKFFFDSNFNVLLK